MKAFDLPVPLGIGLLAVDQQPVEVCDYPHRVFSDEAGTVIEKQDGHEPVLRDELVKSPKEELGVFGSADDDMEDKAGAIIEKEKSDALLPSGAGPEMLPV